MLVLVLAVRTADRPYQRGQLCCDAHVEPVAVVRDSRGRQAEPGSSQVF